MMISFLCVVIHLLSILEILRCCKNAHSVSHLKDAPPSLQRYWPQQECQWLLGRKWQIQKKTLLHLWNLVQSFPQILRLWKKGEQSLWTFREHLTAMIDALNLTKPLCLSPSSENSPGGIWPRMLNGASRAACHIDPLDWMESGTGKKTWQAVSRFFMAVYFLMLHECC